MSDTAQLVLHMYLQICGAPVHISNSCCIVSGRLWLLLYGRLTCICHLLHAYVLPLLVLFCPLFSLTFITF